MAAKLANFANRLGKVHSVIPEFVADRPVIKLVAINKLVIKLDKLSCYTCQVVITRTIIEVDNKAQVVGSSQVRSDIINQGHKYFVNIDFEGSNHSKEEVKNPQRLTHIIVVNSMKVASMVIEVDSFTLVINMVELDIIIHYFE